MKRAKKGNTSGTKEAEPGPHREFVAQLFARNVSPDVLKTAMVSCLSKTSLPSETSGRHISELYACDLSNIDTAARFVGIIGDSALVAELSAMGMEPLIGETGELFLTAGDKVKLLAKIYCHGGDVAFFGSVDLEAEAQINNALYGHSGVYKKRISLLPNVVKDDPDGQVKSTVQSESQLAELSQQVGKRICERLGGCNHSKQNRQLHKYSGKFVGGITNCMILILKKLLEALPSNSRCTTVSLLDAIRRLQSTNRIPANTGARWEQILLERLLVLESNR